MQLTAALFLFVATAARCDAVEAVSPIAKVIEMLNGMLVTGRDEKQKEQVQFAAYNQWCTSVTDEKTRAVESATEKLSMLKADIQEVETSAEELAREVQKLEADVATWEGDEKAATQVREIERADYLKAHNDYTETIDAITTAVGILRAQPQNRAQAVSLLSGSSALAKAPEKAQRMLTAFLSRDMEFQTPEAYAYELRSGGVVDMLEQLKDKFIDERSALEKEETNRRHSYEKLVQELHASKTNAEAMRSGKVQQKAQDLQSAATMKGQVSDTTGTKEQDSKFLEDTKAVCSQKASDFEERQKLRAEEITAIQSAIGILNDMQAPHVESVLIQRLGRNGTKSAMSLVQLLKREIGPYQDEAAKYLQDRAKAIDSRVLSAIAERVSEDPFAKVKKLIQDLIVRLEEEAGEELQHKAWCDKELSSNEIVRTSRSADVEKLTAQIDEKSSNVAQLGSEVNKLSQQQADLATEVATQEKLYQEERAINEQALKDAREAQTAIGQAVTVLKEFYERAGEATALVQGRSRGARQEPTVAEQPPEIFQGSYQGLEGSGGVVAMLETIQSKYALIESSTDADMATGESEYNKFMSDSAVLKTSIAKDIEHKTNQKTLDEQALVDLQTDLTSAQKELDAASNYFEKLKPSCLDAGMSVEERQQRREQEIQSLQEALRILNGEDLATVVSER